jgi:hypothetical protein
VYVWHQQPPGPVGWFSSCLMSLRRAVAPRCPWPDHPAIPASTPSWPLNVFAGPGKVRDLQLVKRTGEGRGHLASSRRYPSGSGLDYTRNGRLSGSRLQSRRAGRQDQLRIGRKRSIRHERQGGRNGRVWLRKELAS